MNIDIPKNENRKFKNGILANKLKYTIIQDDSTDLSNIVMSIRAGSLYDPLEYMGLAHFLEHMLFMGSKKYPEENYFSKKLKECGGTTNAYTDSFETVYYLTLLSNKEKLDELSDIFSRFFIDPLFDINCVSREINAINSEHMKNINSDNWSNRQIIYNLSKKDSSINRFSTGNHETLGDNYTKLRETMIKFYKKYYCSNNMCLTITSNIDIDDIEKIIIKYFSNILENMVEHLVLDKKKYDSYNSEYLLIPVNDVNYIMYFWEVPPVFYFLEDHIINLIDRVINLNAENNIYNILINSKLCSGISSAYLEPGIYLVIVNLLPKNINRSFRIVNNIIKSYFDNLKNLNWDELYKYFIKENKLNYNNNAKQDNLDLAIEMSLNMHYYKITNYYNAKKLILKYNLSKLYDVLKQLTFNKANIIYATKDTSITNGLDFIIDKYYKRSYTKLNQSYLSENERIYDENFKINLNMDVLNIKPKIIHHLDKYNIPFELKDGLYYGSVSKFNEPLVYGRIYIYSSKLYSTILSYIATSISISVINYYMHLMFFQEILLGYNILFNDMSSNGTLVLTISGFNDNYEKIFKSILDKIKTIKPTDNIINSKIDDYKEFLKNMDNISPWAYSNMIISQMMFKYNYNYQDLLKNIGYLTLPLIKERIISLINMNYQTITIIYGNINPPKLYNVNNKSKNIKLVKDKLPLDLTIKHPNKLEKNKCVQMIFHCGKEYEPLLVAKVYLLQSLLERPVFDILRTKHQLGYLVNSFILSTDNNYYICIKVQSEYSTDIILKKIEEFLIDFKDLLKTFNLEEYKQSIYSILTQKHNNMEEMAKEYINEIYNRQFIFDRKIQIAKVIHSIQLSDIEELYHFMILNKTKVIIN